MDQKNNVGDGKNNPDGGNAADKKKPHIKKPLNAFMLYMKEMRAKVVAECTLKESAAINQILGRRVRNLYLLCVVRFTFSKMTFSEIDFCFHLFINLDLSKMKLLCLHIMIQNLVLKMENFENFQ